MVTMDILVPYSQNYLSVILNLSILLATANGILFYNIKHICTKLLFGIAFLLCIASIVVVMSSFESFLDLLLQYRPEKDINFITPFKMLDQVYNLQLLSIGFLILGALIGAFKKEK